MNETPERLICIGVDRKRTVIINESASKRPQGLAKTGFGIVVMVKVNFNLA